MASDHLRTIHILFVSVVGLNNAAADSGMMSYEETKYSGLVQ